MIARFPPAFHAARLSHGTDPFPTAMATATAAAAFAVVGPRPLRLLRRRRSLLPFAAAADADSEAAADEEEALDADSESVRVYDGVLSPDARLALRTLAEEHSLRAVSSDGSSVFYRRSRPPSDDGEDDDGGDPSLTPLEGAIESILATLGDDAPIVEYWSRREYLNMDAHADIDEELLEDGDGYFDFHGDEDDEEEDGEGRRGGILRCPTMGHVLYLDVDDDVRGPTCVFPDRLIGWDCGGDGARGEDSAECGDGYVELVTVPAVPGRLLRFDGRAMHAVPRPADRWLLSDNEERRLRDIERDEADLDFVSDDEEDDGGYRDDDGEEVDDGDGDPLRSVLLFNTWADAPPMGVDLDPATGEPPCGIEIVEVSDDEEANVDDPDAAAPPLRCNDFSEWREAEIADGRAPGEHGDDEGGGATVRVNLMGSRERRVHPHRYARLRTAGPSSTTMASGTMAVAATTAAVALGEALRDPFRPARFRLVREEEKEEADGR